MENNVVQTDDALVCPSCGADVEYLIQLFKYPHEFSYQCPNGCHKTAFFPKEERAWRAWCYWVNKYNKENSNG